MMGKRSGGIMHRDGQWLRARLAIERSGFQIPAITELLISRFLLYLRHLFNLSIPSTLTVYSWWEDEMER